LFRGGFATVRFVRITFAFGFLLPLFCFISLC
jgi:hypothetical protein